MGRLRSEITVPLATGESLYTPHEFLALLTAIGTDIIQPDIRVVGGLTHLVKIAPIAEAHYVPVARHNPLGPLATAVNLHFAAATTNFAAAITNFGVLEYKRVQVRRRFVVPRPVPAVAGYLELRPGPRVGASRSTKPRSKPTTGSPGPGGCRSVRTVRPRGCDPGSFAVGTGPTALRPGLTCEVVTEAGEEELDLLVLRGLQDDEVRAAMREEHVSPPEILWAVANDPAVLGRLRTERTGYLRDPDRTIEVTARIRDDAPFAGVTLPTAGGVAGSVALLAFLVTCLAVLFGWENPPAWTQAVSAIGFFGALLLTTRLLRRAAPNAIGLLRYLADAESRIWRSYAVQEIVLPALRRAVAEQREPVYRTEWVVRAVRDLDAEGTPARIRLWKTIDRSSTGAIALAGHRGAGKSTAIEQVAAGRPGERSPLTVVAAAPASYEARDFVLYLHTLLCNGVLAKTQDSIGQRLEATETSRERAARVARSTFRCLLEVVFVALSGTFAWDLSIGAFAADLGPIVAGFPHSLGRVFAGRSGWQIAVLMLTGLVALHFSVNVAGFLWRALCAVLAGSVRLLRDPGNLPLRRLRREALRHLLRIRFLQTYTTGWSGKLTFPIKGEAGLTRSVQKAEQQLTYPEVVDAFRTFAADVAKVLSEERVADRLIIAIDELDKIGEPEKAQELINDLKGIFDIPGCLFLVSVSDDAIIAFERRGIPARDAFDSAFSEMIRIEQFTPESSRDWIGSRLPGLPEPFRVLCHCVSGGLPRDLRRYVDEMLDIVDGAQAPTLASVTNELIRRELDRKAPAFAGAARTIVSSARRSELIADLVTIPTLRADAELLRLAAKLASAGEGDPALADLGWETGSYLLFCTTIREVFTDAVTEDLLYGIPGGEPQLLAIARQQMAFDPRVSWRLLTEFRAARGLTSVAAGTHAIDRAMLESEMPDLAERALAEATTIAVVGLSRDPAKAAHSVPGNLKAAGFRIIPVHPWADELLGEKVYRSLTDIPGPVDLVDVFRPAEEAPGIAEQAVAIGAKTLWLQQGIVSPEARRIAVEGGLTYVEDRCIAVVRAMARITRT